MFRFCGYLPCPGNTEAFLVYGLLLFIFCLMGGVVGVVGLALVAAVAVPGYRPHNLEGHKLEWAWTIMPMVLLLTVALPTLLTGEFSTSLYPLVAITAVGHQWYWEYQYSGQGSGDSYTIKEGPNRLLSTDAHMVVPAQVPVRVIATSADVVHNFNVKPLAISLDAVPGRFHGKIFVASYPGIYQGLCSEVCGVGHYSMAISMEAVSPEAYSMWANLWCAWLKGVLDVDDYGLVAHHFWVADQCLRFSAVMGGPPLQNFLWQIKCSPLKRGAWALGPKSQVVYGTLPFGGMGDFWSLGSS